MSELSTCKTPRSRFICSQSLSRILQVARVTQRTCILLRKHPLDTLSYLFVREVFAPVELLQPVLDVLAKPCVMVGIILYKLLNIRVGIAAVLGGDTVQLGLQVSAEMYFHGLENRDFQDYCQYDTAWRHG